MFTFAATVFRNGQPAAPRDPAIRALVVGLMLAILLGALDQTIVAVSLPAMGQELGGLDLLPWVVSGYLVAMTVAVPIYGKLGDLYGRRAVLSFAIGLFLLASIACAMASSMEALIAARIVQGLGGGGLISVSQAAIADVVSPRERGRYQGYISGTFAMASVLGPLVGGALSEWLSWRWIFWINLPLGLLALGMARRTLAPLLLPQSRPRLDIPGALLLVAGLTPVLLALSRVGQGRSWLAADTLALLLAGAALLAVCVQVERRAAEPIIPLHLFAVKTVRLCWGIVFLVHSVSISLAALTPLRFSMVAGSSAAESALGLIPLAAGLPIGSYFAGSLMSRYGRYRPLQLVGAVLLPLALLGLAFTDPRQALPTAFFMLMAGIASGMMFPTSLVAVQNAVEKRQIGTATAGHGFFRSLGGALGIAVLGAVLLASLPEGTLSLSEQPVSTPLAGVSPALANQAFQRVFLLSALLACIPLVLAWRLPEQALRGADGPS